jgi:hypothetical protein
MCDAIHAAEAEAQRKVEESYQEASCAGEQYNLCVPPAVNSTYKGCSYRRLESKSAICGYAGYLRSGESEG